MNRPLLHLLVLTVVCVAVFSNTFENGFHYDDAHRVLNNPGVQVFAPPWRHFTDPATSATLPRIVQYRPLLPLSLSINHAIAGDSVAGYRIGNLLLQILASFALYFFVRELFTHWSQVALPGLGALLVASMFAVHPVSGIVVNYICARDLAMMQMFLLASLHAYARMRRLGETGGRWALCLSLLLLSLLAKKNAVAAPALVLLFELLPAGQSIGRLAVWRRMGAYAAAVAGLLLYVRFGLGFSDFGNVVAGTKTPVEYAAAQSQHHVFHYLRNFVWPFPIRQAPADPVVAWRQVAGLLVIAGASALAWRWRRTRPLLSFGICGYAALLALTSTVLVLHADIVAYRPYPASAFLFLFAGAGLLRWRRFGVPVLAACTVYFGVCSYAMNPDWRDVETANRHSIAHGGAPAAFTSLAEVLPPGPEKIALYEHAVGFRTDATALLGLARAEVEWGTEKDDLALQNRGLDRLGHVISFIPDNAQARYTAAQILFSVRHLGDSLQKAADQAAKASALAPRNQVYRCMAGMCAVEAQRFEQGLQILQPLLAERPDFGITRLCAGIAHMELRQFAAAAPLLETFVAQNPQHYFAWRHLGLVRIGLRDWQGAERALRAAAAGDPTIPGVQDALARCRRALGR